MRNALKGLKAIFKFVDRTLWMIFFVVLCWVGRDRKLMELKKIQKVLQVKLDALFVFACQ